MGILGMKPVLVVQCGHCEHAQAFWLNDNDGAKPPDLFFRNFPPTGRVKMTNQVLYLACRMCETGLDAVYADSIKAREH